MPRALRAKLEKSTVAVFLAGPTIYEYYIYIYTFIDMIPWLHMVFTTHYSTPKNQEHLRQCSRQFVRPGAHRDFMKKTPLSSAVVHGHTVDGRNPAPVHMIHIHKYPTYTPRRSKKKCSIFFCSSLLFLLECLPPQKKRSISFSSVAKVHPIQPWRAHNLL